MPSRRTKRQPTKKKSSGRGRSRKGGDSNTVSGSHLSPSRVLSLLPETFHAKHKYVDTLTPVSGVAIIGNEFSYALNGMWDPYTPAGGHQPYGFDQLAAMYNAYVVTSCHISVTLSVPSTADCYFAYAWGPSSAPGAVASFSFTGANNIGEKDNARWFMLPTAQANTKDFTVDLGTFNIGNVESKSNKIILTDINYQGGVGNNPPACPNICFGLGTLATTGSTVTAVVQITYHATWRGRKTLTGS